MIRHRHDPGRLVPYDEMMRCIIFVQLELAMERNLPSSEAYIRAERILADIESGRPMRYEKRHRFRPKTRKDNHDLPFAFV